MKRLIVWLPLAVLAGLAVLFAVFALHHDPQVQPQALVGKPTPDLRLTPLDGGPPVRLRAVARGPLLINVFASWCAPCEVEQPVLLGLKAAGAPILGVAYKDAPEKTGAFLGRLGDPFTAVLVDRDGRAGIEFGVTGVPETYAVDARGIIVAKHSGPLTAAEGRRLLALARR